MAADLVIFPPPAAPPPSPAAQARHLHPAALPQWRALLTDRRQEQLEEVSELSRACQVAQHAAANARQGAWQQASAALQRAAAGWLALAEIEAALARLATGRILPALCAAKRGARAVSNSAQMHSSVRARGSPIPTDPAGLAASYA